ncbi:MAG: MBL fold metallo-hydrolase [Christensenellaceae bacterium]|jgi:beta-lactamase superfamily II metal-dependent hydrolase|nr:MBL fold metallo-hydrolase [Christensenellaceae bacterium]
MSSSNTPKGSSRRSEPKTSSSDATSKKRKYSNYNAKRNAQKQSVNDTYNYAYQNNSSTSKSYARSSRSANKLAMFINMLLIIVIIVALITMVTVFRDEISIAIKNIKINTNANPNTQEGTPDPDPEDKTPSGDHNYVDSGEFIADKNGLEVHFMNVGQGDSILIRFLTLNTTILMDAGSSTGSGSTTVANHLISYINALGVEKIDHMIATHADSDHINLADNILNEYSVTNIYYNDIETEFDADPTANKTVQDTLEDLAEAEPGATITRFNPNGETYTLVDTAGYKFTIYAPGQSVLTDDNAMSPICVLEYATRRIVFTGDATTETEEWFIESQNKLGITSLDCDVLKVGHHGSASSSGKVFLEFLTPEYGVISVAETNSYKHPDYAVMNRLFSYGIVTYRTNRQGDIALCIDSDGNFAFFVSTLVPADNNKNGIPELMYAAP